MANLVENYDVVIVGAGHAGCEAALASARLGLNTIVFTVSVDSIALMPCNPNIEMCIRDSYINVAVLIISDKTRCLRISEINFYFFTI